MSAPADPVVPVALGEFVLALLIGAGYVTQAKVDEARRIALGSAPGPITPPPSPTYPAEVERLVECLRGFVEHGYSSEQADEAITALAPFAGLGVGK